MSLKRLTVAVMVSVFALAAHAAAQKNELSGLVGRTFISDQIITTSTFSDNKLRFGNGLTFEGNYARRVVDGGLIVAVAGSSVRIQSRRGLAPAYQPRSRPITNLSFVTPAARLNVFSGSGVSPWVSVGGGFGYFRGSTDLFRTNTRSEHYWRIPDWGGLGCEAHP